MAARNAVLYSQLYKNLFEATDILFTNATAKAFVKHEIREEFQTNRHFTHPKIVRKQLARGHDVLSSMVDLIQHKPEYQNNNDDDHHDHA